MSTDAVKNLPPSSAYSIPLAVVAGVCGYYTGYLPTLLVAGSGAYIVNKIQDSGLSQVSSKISLSAQPLFEQLGNSACFQRISKATKFFTNWLSAKSPLTNADRLAWGTIGGTAGGILAYGSDTIMKYAYPAVPYVARLCRTGFFYGGTQLAHWASFAAKETLELNAQAFYDVKYASDTREENNGFPWIPLVAGGILLTTQFASRNLFPKAEEKIPMLEPRTVPNFRRKNAFELTDETYQIDNPLNVLHMDNPNPFSMKFRDGKVRTVDTVTKAVVAQMFTKTEDIDAICACKDSQAIITAFNKISKNAVDNWDETYFIVNPGKNIIETGMKIGHYYLYEVLRAKFAQHPEVYQALMQTGNVKFDHKVSLELLVPFGKYAEMLYYFRQDQKALVVGSQHPLALGAPKPKPAKQEDPAMLELELVDFTRPIEHSKSLTRIANYNHVLHNDCAANCFKAICGDRRIRTFKCVTSFVLAHQFLLDPKFTSLLDEFAVKSGKEAAAYALELIQNQTVSVDPDWEHNYLDTNYRQYGITKGQFWLWQALKAKFGQHPTLIEALKATTKDCKIEHLYEYQLNTTVFNKTDQFLYYIKGEKPPSPRHHLYDVVQQAAQQTRRATAGQHDLDEKSNGTRLAGVVRGKLRTPASSAHTRLSATASDQDHRFAGPHPSQQPGQPIVEDAESGSDDEAEANGSSQSTPMRLPLLGTSSST